MLHKSIQNITLKYIKIKNKKIHKETMDGLCFTQSDAQAVVAVWRHTAPGQMPKMSASIEAQ